MYLRFSLVFALLPLACGAPPDASAPSPAVSPEPSPIPAVVVTPRLAPAPRLEPCKPHAELACYRVAKAGGAGADEAVATLREECKTRRGTIACAGIVDLLGASLVGEELEDAAEHGCHPHAEREHDIVALQAAACMRAADARRAKGHDLYAREQLTIGCSFGSDDACAKKREVEASLRADGRTLEPIPFKISGIVDETKTYRIADVGCQNHSSGAGLGEFFGTVGAPFFEKKKAVLACMATTKRVPVTWHIENGKLTEVHAAGPAAACVERAVKGVVVKKSKVSLTCTGLVVTES